MLILMHITYVGTTYQPACNMCPLVRCACFGCMTDRQIGKRLMSR